MPRDLCETAVAVRKTSHFVKPHSARAGYLLTCQKMEMVVRLSDKCAEANESRHPTRDRK